MARHQLREEAQSVVVMPIREFIQSRRLTSIFPIPRSILEIHNCEHHVHHDSIRCGWRRLILWVIKACKLIIVSKGYISGVELHYRCEKARLV